VHDLAEGEELASNILCEASLRLYLRRGGAVQAIATCQDCLVLCVGAHTATNLSIDPDLIERALEVSGERTKKVAVTRALQEVIARSRQKRLLDLSGKLEWVSSYHYKAGWRVIEPLCGHQHLGLPCCGATHQLRAGKSRRSSKLLNAANEIVIVGSRPAWSWQLGEIRSMAGPDLFNGSLRF